MTGRGARRRDRRTHRIPVRLTYQELAEARLRAHKAGRTLARYIREAALGGKARPLRLQVHADVVHGLSSIVRQLYHAKKGEAAAAITGVLPALREILSRITT